MKKEEIFSKISKLFSENSAVKESGISMETSIQKDLGLDSMKLVVAVMEIEKLFKVEIPDRKLFKLKTVGAMVDFIVERRAKLAIG